MRVHHPRAAVEHLNFALVEPKMMSVDEALKLDEPEGSVVVQVSAKLFHRLVRYRDTARILASGEE